MPELNWMGDANARRAALKVPYRLLEVVDEVGDATGGNLLVQGDNLEALRSLLPLYGGRVKCVFIDPPYNTKSAFEHYDDNLEHSQWLSMMYPRLVLLRDLLSEDGSIWVTIDDNEAHYLKVMMDEVFGRGNFIADIAWKRRDGAPNDRKVGSTYDHLLVSAKSRNGNTKKTRAEEAFNLMQRTEKADSQYRLYEEPFGFDERGPFRKVDSTGNAKGGRYVESLIYPVTNPFTGEIVFPRKGRCWVYKQEDMLAMVADRRFFWGKDGKAGTPMRKLFKTEAKLGMSAPTIWDDVGLNQHAAREIELLFGEKAAFETPKPEGLLKRVVEIATNPGDLILDSFLGSGTTAAVAHKMGRQWIGIEMGEHARTHCLLRLGKVVEGEQGGISQAVGWGGGGGFRFATLGAPVFDSDGRINAAVRFAPLAAYLWREQIHDPHPTGVFTSPLLGLHGDTALVLLYNGILGDRRPNGGNVLTPAVWEQIRALAPGHVGRWLVFGEASRLTPAIRKRFDIAFKQIPYEIGVGQ
jgi:adenine-specific DNA-methyltransferase